MYLNSLRSELKSLANPEKAKLYQKYFKTGKGEYGEGDVFLGITVPEQRKIAKKFFKELTLGEIQVLLNSKIHEERFTALEALNFRYEKSLDKESLAKFYLKNTKKINNWDLVDTSAPYILGSYLENKDKSVLYRLAKSSNLWERRIAIISTFHFIKDNRFEDSLKLAEILLQDSHDLIHKAVGWMLREVGKRNINTLEIFLKENYRKMPRTMLRYAIEKLSKNKRQNYLKDLV